MALEQDMNEGALIKLVRKGFLWTKISKIEFKYDDYICAKYNFSN